MKVHKRPGRASAQLVVSIPKDRIVAVESATNYLEQKFSQAASPAALDAILRAARMDGWRDPSEQVTSPENRG
jgi:hypothetical protein